MHVSTVFFCDKPRLLLYPPALLNIAPRTHDNDILLSSKSDRIDGIANAKTVNDDTKQYSRSCRLGVAIVSVFPSYLNRNILYVLVFRVRSKQFRLRGCDDTYNTKIYIYLIVLSLLLTHTQARRNGWRCRRYLFHPHGARPGLRPTEDPSGIQFTSLGNRHRKTKLSRKSR